jgi:serine/threonine-protein kinase
MSDKLPLTLGRYQLTEKIGAGAMGVVYKGHDPLIGRPVAVKLIRTDLLDESERDSYRARFRQEVRSAGRCVHPGIVTVYDFAERDGDPYIVMEYVEGPILQRLFGKGRLPVDQAVDITLQLLAALGHAHAQGVVHRDIKPANIIVGPGARVKITDFGIARMEASALTNAGTLLGTPSYMAPEQARGERVDHRADLFAVGVVFLRMLTGALPYGDESFAAVLHKMAAPDPIDVSAVDAIEPRLAAVAALALAKNPAERFQSAEEFEHLLRSMSVEHSEAEIWPGMAEEAAAASLPPAAAPSAPSPTALPPSTAAAAPKSPSAPAAPGSWPDDLLARLKAALAHSVGPIAGLLVTRTAASSATPEDLVQGLCLLIDNETARAKFAAAARTIAGLDAVPPPASPPRAAAAETFGAVPAAPVVSIGVMSSAQALLARFIGPIARVLVRQSSLEVRSLDEFSDRLASHIDKDEERTRFKRDLADLIDHQ